MPDNSPAKALPPTSGFAGFRLQEAREGALDWHNHDWIAFLGASYFRAIGELNQYGASARGISIDTGMDGVVEEFPAFTKFFIGPQSGDTVTVHALLDGPSVAGAFRFQLTRRADVRMEVEQTLYMRQGARRLGVAPLTSMFWFSETLKPTAIDWRPEVHDSDGLAIWTGAGERVWRPLNNPARANISAFKDENPRGFGLMQRDRSFDHYGDGVRYERRPSIWVEPIGNWGKGSVELVELPTADETSDNIVAMWKPQEAPQPGAELNFHYRMYWVADEPFPPPLARCVATRLGGGGYPGQKQASKARKFMVEFKGGALTNVPANAKVEAVVSTTRGAFTEYRITEPVPDSDAHWRTQFDLLAEGDEPAELRCFLQMGGQTLSETWAFQYHPF